MGETESKHVNKTVFSDRIMYYELNSSILLCAGHYSQCFTWTDLCNPVCEVGVVTFIGQVQN